MNINLKSQKITEFYEGKNAFESIPPKRRRGRYKTNCVLRPSSHDQNCFTRNRTITKKMTMKKKFNRIGQWTKIGWIKKCKLIYKIKWVTFSFETHLTTTGCVTDLD